MSELLARFEAKRQAVPEGAVETRELFREAMAEHVAATVPVASATQTAVAPVLVDLSTPPTPEVAQKVSELVQLAFTRGLTDAIRQAETSGSYVLALFHEQLVDEYWQKLVDSGKIIT